MNHYRRNIGMRGGLLTTVLLAAALLLSACGQGGNAGSTQKDAGAEGAKTLRIVSTNFAGYDFARAVVGDREDVQLKMLLKPGAESHSYEPTPQDMIAIQESDLFIYAGGDSDEWVEEVLQSMNQEEMQLFRLMDQVALIEEEEEIGFAPDTAYTHSHTHGETEEHDHAEDEDQDEHDHEHADEDHDHEEHDHEHAEEEDHDDHGHEEGEMDEHVWTSPVNAITIMEHLRDTIQSLDPEGSAAYEENTAEYIRELEALDETFRSLVENASRREIIVADRFPFGYFVKEYGLSYYAAFPGCATDTQPSAKTVAFLMDKVVEDQIPVVFHIELSNEDMCDNISQETGAKKELLYAVHNVTDAEFQAGMTYIDMMKHNASVLEEALH